MDASDDMQIYHNINGHKQTDSQSDTSIFALNPHALSTTFAPTDAGQSWDIIRHSPHANVPNDTRHVCVTKARRRASPSDRIHEKPSTNTGTQSVLAPPASSTQAEQQEI
jgi:hypothetical protein